MSIFSKTAAELTDYSEKICACLLLNSLAWSKFPRNMKHLLGFLSYFRVILVAASEAL